MAETQPTGTAAASPELTTVMVENNSDASTEFEAVPTSSAGAPPANARLADLTVVPVNPSGQALFSTRLGRYPKRPAATVHPAMVVCSDRPAAVAAYAHCWRDRFPKQYLCYFPKCNPKFEIGDLFDDNDIQLRGKEFLEDVLTFITSENVRHARLFIDEWCTKNHERRHIFGTVQYDPSDPEGIVDQIYVNGETEKYPRAFLWHAANIKRCDLLSDPNQPQATFSIANTAAAAAAESHSNMPAGDSKPAVGFPSNVVEGDGRFYRGQTSVSGTPMQAPSAPVAMPLMSYQPPNPAFGPPVNTHFPQLPYSNVPHGAPGPYENPGQRSISKGTRQNRRSSHSYNQGPPPPPPTAFRSENIPMPPVPYRQRQFSGNTSAGPSPQMYPANLAEPHLMNQGNAMISMWHHQNNGAPPAPYPIQAPYPTAPGIHRQQTGPYGPPPMGQLYPVPHSGGFRPTGQIPSDMTNGQYFQNGNMPHNEFHANRSHRGSQADGTLYNPFPDQPNWSNTQGGQGGRRGQRTSFSNPPNRGRRTSVGQYNNPSHVSYPTGAGHGPVPVRGGPTSAPESVPGHGESLIGAGLIIFNLPQNATEKDVEDFYHQNAGVKPCDVVIHADRNQRILAKSFFQSLAQAQHCYEHGQGKLLLKQKVYPQFQEPSKNRQRSSTQQGMSGTGAHRGTPKPMYTGQDARSSLQNHQPSRTTLVIPETIQPSESGVSPNKNAEPASKASPDKKVPSGGPTYSSSTVAEPNDSATKSTPDVLAEKVDTLPKPAVGPTDIADQVEHPGAGEGGANAVAKSAKAQSDPDPKAGKREAIAEVPNHIDAPSTAAETPKQTFVQEVGPVVESAKAPASVTTEQEKHAPVQEKADPIVDFVEASPIAVEKEKPAPVHNGEAPPTSVEKEKPAPVHKETDVVGDSAETVTATTKEGENHHNTAVRVDTNITSSKGATPRAKKPKRNPPAQRKTGATVESARGSTTTASTSAGGEKDKPVEKRVDATGPSSTATGPRTPKARKQKHPAAEKKVDAIASAGKSPAAPKAKDHRHPAVENEADATASAKKGPATPKAKDHRHPAAENEVAATASAEKGPTTPKAKAKDHRNPAVENGVAATASAEKGPTTPMGMHQKHYATETKSDEVTGAPDGATSNKVEEDRRDAKTHPGKEETIPLPEIPTSHTIETASADPASSDPSASTASRGASQKHKVSELPSSKANNKSKAEFGDANHGQNVNFFGPLAPDEAGSDDEQKNDDSFHTGKDAQSDSEKVEPREAESTHERQSPRVMSPTLPATETQTDTKLQHEASKDVAEPDVAAPSVAHATAATATATAAPSATAKKPGPKQPEPMLPQFSSKFQAKEKKRKQQEAKKEKEREKRERENERKKAKAQRADSAAKLTKTESVTAKSQDKDKTLALPGLQSDLNATESSGRGKEKQGTVQAQPAGNSGSDSADPHEDTTGENYHDAHSGSPIEKEEQEQPKKHDAAGVQSYERGSDDAMKETSGGASGMDGKAKMSNKVAVPAIKLSSKKASPDSKSSVGGSTAVTDKGKETARSLEDVEPTNSSNSKGKEPVRQAEDKMPTSAQAKTDPRTMSKASSGTVAAINQSQGGPSGTAADHDTPAETGSHPTSQSELPTKAKNKRQKKKGSKPPATGAEEDPFQKQMKEIEMVINSKNKSWDTSSDTLSNQSPVVQTAKNGGIKSDGGDTAATTSASTVSPEEVSKPKLMGMGIMDQIRGYVREKGGDYARLAIQATSGGDSREDPDNATPSVIVDLTEALGEPDGVDPYIQAVVSGEVRTGDKTFIEAGPPDDKKEA